MSEWYLWRAEEQEGDALRGVREADTTVLRSKHLGWMALDMVVHEMAGIRLVGEATAVAASLCSVERLRPELVIATGEPGEMPAATLTHEIQALSPMSKILVLGEELDYELLPGLHSVGVQGYLLWAELSTGSLAAAIRSVLAGQYVASPGVWHELVARRQHPHGETIHLTDEERAVAQAIRRGLRVPEIAAREHVSPRHVERIVNRLKVKLGAENRSVLGIKLAELGLGG